MNAAHKVTHTYEQCQDSLYDLTPHVPPSISSLRTYGVSKSLLHSISINLFTLPPEIRDCFCAYYLKYWQGEYFCDQVEDGAITDCSRNYLVIYQHCTPFQVRRAKQVKLSFRAAMPEFDIPAYVIVKLA